MCNRRTGGSLWDHSRTLLGDFWQQGPLVLVFFEALRLTVLPRAGGAVAPRKKILLIVMVQQWYWSGWAMWTDGGI